MAKRAVEAHVEAHIRSGIGHEAVDPGLQFPDRSAKVGIENDAIDYTINGTNHHDIIHATDPIFEVNGKGGADLITYSGQLYTQLAGYDSGSMGEGVDRADTIQGGSGKDFILGCAGGDRLQGAAGDDIIFGAIGTLAQEASDGADHVDGGTGDDIAHGNLGDDVLRGGAGDDLLVGEWGNDKLVGGAGMDRANYNFSTLTAGISFSGASFVSGATQNFADGLGGVDRLYSIEHISLTGTHFSDTLAGSAVSDTLIGGGGTDLLDGGAGDDTIAGSGTLIGGEGSDVFFVGFAFSTIEGGAGVNTVNLDWSFSSSAMTVYLSQSGQLSGSSADGYLEIQGDGVSAMTFTGGAGDDTITGGPGDDRIGGSVGDNRLDGGAGRDTYVVDASEGGQFHIDASAFDNNGGSSVISTRLGTDHVIGFEMLEVLGSQYADSIIGSTGDDVLTDGAVLAGPNGGGGGGFYQLDTIDGGAGNDIIVGGFLGGEQILTGGAGIDALYCSSQNNLLVDLKAGTVAGNTISGFEVVIGSDYDDTVLGGKGGETLNGAAGDDVLNGGKGKDMVDGGRGSDVLIGGLQGDVFRFSEATASVPGQTDRIADLTDIDRIDLSGIDADTTVQGNQSFHLVNELQGNAGELALSYVHKADQSLLVGDLDGDGLADFAVVINGDHRDFSNYQL